MNDANSVVEVTANLALSDFKRRERLLEIVRGKSQWKYYTLAGIWCVCIGYIFYAEKANNTLGFVLIPLLFTIVGAYVDCSRRMNALIALIGEDNLRKTK